MKKNWKGLAFLASMTIVVAVAFNFLEPGAQENIRMEMTRYAGVDVQFMLSVVGYFVIGSFLFGWIVGKVNRQN